MSLLACLLAIWWEAEGGSLLEACLMEAGLGAGPPFGEDLLFLFECCLLEEASALWALVLRRLQVLL